MDCCETSKQTDGFRLRFRFIRNFAGFLHHVLWEIIIIYIAIWAVVIVFVLIKVFLIQKVQYLHQMVFVDYHGKTHINNNEITASMATGVIN